ncbi:MAG: hypothetical protein U1E87_06405 [Alphaproteobacteria bacterium]
MLSRIFPREIDNTYGGHWPALVLLVPILFVYTVMSINISLNTYEVATTADNIPLDSYPAGAASIILKSFKAWAHSQLLLTLLGWLCLIRYRAMVPLYLLIMTLENLSRNVTSMPDPIHTMATLSPIGAVINLALLVGLVLGLVFSLMRK